jgi:hypothetical protein
LYPGLPLGDVRSGRKRNEGIGGETKEDAVVRDVFIPKAIFLILLAAYIQHPSSPYLHTSTSSTLLALITAVVINAYRYFG